MFHRMKPGLFLFTISLLACAATAQVMSIPSSAFGNIGTAGTSGMPNGIEALSTEQMTNDLWWLNGRQSGGSPLNSPMGSVSALDLKAPGKARKEFAKGYQLLMRKDYSGAVEHLTSAISIYPDFVAAHNALGSAFMGFGQNQKARDEFAKAAALDDHLPISFFNLGCAQIALQDFAAAEASVQKASLLAPADLQLATALAYAQFMNRDYEAVLNTTASVHKGKHRGAAMVHYFAAAAWDGQDNLPEAQNELRTLLQEDPNSSAAEQARSLLAQMKIDQIKKDAIKKDAEKPRSESLASPQSSQPEPVPAGPTPEQLAMQAQIDAQLEAQDTREQQQIVEAEATPDSVCATCTSATASSRGPTSARSASGPTAPSATRGSNGVFTLRTVVDEVAVFFAATDHGKSVTDLTPADIGIRDDEKSPAVVTGFRNQAQLPLRLGIIIDTSESVASRFSFEQHAATNFLQKVLTDKNDLAFVVGAANSILLVQDFTSDQSKMVHAIDQLAPAGGTAIWDAVAYAADKLASPAEDQPVARILVIISDGKDNSSSTTLKETIAAAEHDEVFVYTVSTREATDSVDDLTRDTKQSPVGDHALKVLAENTGGAAFVPGSVRWLSRSLDDLQEVIRSRYLISYKPALFQRDGRYRSIGITAQKSGHKLHVYSRKGYYASVAAPDETHPSRE
jgi:VWFA-related protein